MVLYKYTLWFSLTDPVLLQGLVPGGQAGKNPCPHEAPSLVGETNNKMNLYY